MQFVPLYWVAAIGYPLVPPRGAHASATLFSLIDTAKANGLEPYRYLRYLFTKLPLVRTRDEYRNLTPHLLDLRDFQSAFKLDSS